MKCIRNRGFTLIETIIVVGIFTVTSVAILGGALFLFRTNANTTEQAFALMSARRGVESLVENMRAAESGIGGLYAIDSIDLNEFSFYSDYDDDDVPERVRYFLQNSVLERGIIEPSGSPTTYDTGDEVISTIATDLRNASTSVNVFTYYDTNGVVITDMNDATDVRFVDVELIVNINPSRLPEDFVVRCFYHTTRVLPDF